MKNNKIKFVQLEPGAFLTDPDFIKMSPAQRGIYISLILALYCNNGQLKLDKNIGKICGCSYKIFLSLFSKISHKFREKNGKIFHKKVSKVLSHQKYLRNIARNSGLKGGRPKKGTLFNENEKGNETRTKNVNLNNSNSNIYDCLNSNQSPGDSISTNNLVRSSNSIRSRVEGFQPSNSENESLLNPNLDPERKEVLLKALTGSLRFSDDLNKILYAKSRSDRTCFNRVVSFLCEGVKSGKFNNEIFDRALSYAKEAKSGENPNALFMSLMSSQLGYERGPGK